MQTDSSQPTLQSSHHLSKRWCNQRELGRCIVFDGDGKPTPTKIKALLRTHGLVDDANELTPLALGQGLARKEGNNNMLVRSAGKWRKQKVLDYLALQGVELHSDTQQRVILARDQLATLLRQPGYSVKFQKERLEGHVYLAQTDADRKAFVGAVAQLLEKEFRPAQVQALLEELGQYNMYRAYILEANLSEPEPVVTPSRKPRF